ncbi:MAG: right-handed parallel beta-helix repeat-containing protein [Alphaproteobacteria bacterium]|nr:right-handed parallel beta-helix repeat-containing protein [Alphaproteobacteria bacterium]
MALSMHSSWAKTVLNPTTCPGTNTKQINAALKSGGVVHLNAGTYLINDTIVLNCGTTLEGDRGAVIKVASGVNWAQGKSIIRGTNVKNVRITGFEIDGNRDNNIAPYSASNAWGHNYYIMFALSGVTNVEIDNMYLHDNWDDIINAVDSKNLNIHDNIFRRPGHDIVAITNTGTTYVTNNCMRVFGNSGARANKNSGPMYVINNNITREANDTGYTGIEVKTASASVYNCNNTIYNLPVNIALVSGGTIHTGGCPISPAVALSASSCNVADLASTSSSGSDATSGSTSSSLFTGTDDSDSSSSGSDSSDTSSSSSSSSGAAANYSGHILGGFGAYSATSMGVIKNLNMNAAMNYVSISSGLNAAHSSLLTYANRAASAGIKLIDDIPDQLIRRYHEDGNLTTLLADMTTHVKYVASNSTLKSTIVGYWMIDDWYTDFGTAKIPLQKMTALVHQYTPGKYAICGFTGNTGYGGSVSGYAKFAANFSPSGCDMVGVYLYPWGTNKVPMTNLANIVAALKQNGWNPSTTPLVGIPQSYGGMYGYTVPTAAQVQSQTKYFCQLGAKHIVYYDFKTGTNATTNSAIQAGIRAGLADCAAIWGQ